MENMTSLQELMLKAQKLSLKLNAEAECSLFKKKYNCLKCKDTLHLFRIGADGYEYFYPCDCRARVINLEQIERSGLSKAFEKWDFETFKPRNEKQQKVYDVCFDYAENGGNNWLFMGGQSGFGKTHLATAVCKELIKTAPLKYVSWTETVKPLKFKQTDDDFEMTLTPLKQVKVLYLDDLFKTKQGDKEKISGSDIQVVFEILDYRVKANLKTIITCEYTVQELAGIDQALIGRVVEMADNYVISINHDVRQNQRLNNVLEI